MFWKYLFEMFRVITLLKVVIKYQSLVDGEDLSESIEAAYGYDGYALYYMYTTIFILPDFQIIRVIF